MKTGLSQKLVTFRTAPFLYITFRGFWPEQFIIFNYIDFKVFYNKNV